MDQTPYLAAPFDAFVLICDRDRDVGPRAAAAFQKLLRGRRKGRSPHFHRMLAHCAENYATLWRDYATGKQPLSLHRFHELWLDVGRQLPQQEVALIESDLSRAARRLFHAGFRLRPRPSRRKAYADFLCVLRERRLPDDLPPPSAAGPSAGRDASPAAGRAPAARPTQPQSGADSGGPARSDLARSSATSSGTTRDAPRLPPLPSPGQIWSKGPLTLVCAKITDEARGVRTFSFTSREVGWFRYEPGQFLTIEPVIDGKIMPRSYTISSTPTRPARLEITVKRVVGGLVSNWLHDTLTVGAELKARGPFGRFSCLRRPAERYLFLSAGSGVTPLMSMLRYLNDTIAPVDVIFFQSATTEADLVFRSELALLQQTNPRIHVALSLTSPSPDGGWDGLTGRLDNDLLLRIAPDLLERFVLACGPTGFMEKAKQLLVGNGFPLASQFDEESFVPKHRAPDRSPAPASRTARKIVFVKSARSYEAAGGQTILDAAEACGIAIPSACRQGRCGTCRATRLSGDIVMGEQEALTPEELAGGQVLTCIAQPVTDTVEVDL